MPEPSERLFLPLNTPRDLERLLGTSRMQARMAAAGVVLADLGFPEHPPLSSHDALWALILEERPDWRQWYEAAQAEARVVFADVNWLGEETPERTYSSREVRQRLQHLP